MLNLQDKDLSCNDINLNVSIKTSTMKENEWDVNCKSNMKYLYYSVTQTIARHTVTGFNLGTGDLLGSGTILSIVLH